MTTELVQLVNENNDATGVMEKMKAHETAALHRAVSVFIFNTAGYFLLQQRAGSKYHSALLWTNTCCTHPRPGEDARAAAERRLQEEMGLSCSLTYQFDYLYKAALDNGLTEHEYDHIYFGISDATPRPNPAEVASWVYLPEKEITQRLQERPESFTAWFHLLYDQVKSRL